MLTTDNVNIVLFKGLYFLNIDDNVPVTSSPSICKMADSCSDQFMSFQGLMAVSDLYNLSSKTSSLYTINQLEYFHVKVPAFTLINLSLA